MTYRPNHTSFHRKPTAVAAAVLIVVTLASVIRTTSALAVTVNQVECVSETVLFPGDTVHGNFMVIRHDVLWGQRHPGMEFTVMSPDNEVVHTLKKSVGDKFEFKAPKRGTYKFCFRNPLPTPESVSFYIRTGHIPTADDTLTNDHFDPVNSKIAELRQALEYVTAEQKYLKARETSHRYTNESTRKRLLFYTVTEYVLLAMASGLQVLYIKRLFGKSIAYNFVG